MSHRNTLVSVCALTDKSENVLERYRYDAYGGCTVLDADGSADSDGISDVSNAYAFTGRRLDLESDLMQYRHRHHSPTLGRFIGRDPRGHVDGMCLYCAVFVPSRVDPLGMQIATCFVPLLGPLSPDRLLPQPQWRLEELTAVDPRLEDIDPRKFDSWAEFPVIYDNVHQCLHVSILMEIDQQRVTPLFNRSYRKYVPNFSLTCVGALCTICGKGELVTLMGVGSAACSPYFDGYRPMQQTEAAGEPYPQDVGQARLLHWKAVGFHALPCRRSGPDLPPHIRSEVLRRLKKKWDEVIAW